MSSVKKPPVKEAKSLFENKASGDSRNLEREFSKFREELKGMFLEQDKKITDKLQKIDDRFSKIIEDFKQELTEVKEEVSVTKQNLVSVSEKVIEIEKSLDFQSKTALENEKQRKENLKKTEENLDLRIEILNQKLMLMEKQDRKYNLLVYGINERKPENIYDVARNLFIDDLGIDTGRVNNMYFANGHRLKSVNGVAPRPFIIRFTSSDDWELVLSQAYKLGGKQKRITSDLPVIMKKERGRLVKEAYKIRKEENLQTRIREKGLQVILEVRKESGEEWERRDVSK